MLIPKFIDRLGDEMYCTTKYCIWETDDFIYIGNRFVTKFNSFDIIKYHM